MRLHTLTVQAFGPFADEQRVDFDRLSAGGLFLIHGPTGAGKTSVLDAVCFALYGQVPGTRGAERSFKSDHAPPDREPRVDLELTVAGRRLWIRRKPAWLRPKKRGEGTTRQNTKVLVMERHTDHWEDVTNRPDEAGQFIGDLIGLTLPQFCQIVLLPQGDFARFLRAKAEDRRQSLERIFNTRVFRDVEDWFQSHAKQLRYQVQSAQERVHETAGRISEAGRSPAPSDPEELSAWAAELAAVTAATARDAATVAAGATGARDAALDAREAGRRTRERQDRLARARLQYEESGEHAEERAEIDVRLADAERAASVLPFLEARNRSCTELEKAEATVAERVLLVRGLPGAVTEPVTAGPLEGAERDRRDETARLDALLGDAERHSSLGHTVTALSGRLDRLREDLDGTRQKVAALPPEVEKAEEELSRVRERAVRAEVEQTALEAARRRLAAAEEHTALVRDLAAAEDAARAAVDTDQNTREHALRLRERRTSHMAAELAGRLVGGEPCPVCGSPDHPAPARPAEEGLVTDEQERAAQAAADAAAAHRSEAESAVAALRERREGAATRAEGRTAASAREEVDTREHALARARSAADEARRLEKAVGELTAALERHREREGDLVRQEAQVRTELDHKAAQRDELARKLDAARGDDPGIGERITRLRGEADLLRAAADAVHARERAAEEARTAAAEAEVRWEEAGFGSEGLVREAALDERERRGLRERARGLDRLRAAAEADLADPELAAAAAEPSPDLDALASEAALAAEAADHAVSWRSGLEERARRLAELRGELGTRLSGCEPLLHEYGVAEGMRALTAGTSADNTDGVRLSAYVLAARLERVVAAANDRLLTMSDGRYELRYTVDKASGDGRSRSAGGLGMRVVDAWTGAERDPATLSGGETFFSSLALALGLGDVAGAEAGGADIDTLFVDEGFGTLDEDTLEEVLDVLDRLRDGGRAVGVVSHVADLRQRVSTRLRIVKGASGSRVEHTG